MQGLQKFIDEQNKRFYNPAGLNICWPKDVAFMFVSVSLTSSLKHVKRHISLQLEIEYY